MELQCICIPVHAKRPQYPLLSVFNQTSSSLTGLPGFSFFLWRIFLPHSLYRSFVANAAADACGQWLFISAAEFRRGSTGIRSQLRVIKPTPPPAGRGNTTHPLSRRRNASRQFFPQYFCGSTSRPDNDRVPGADQAPGFSIPVTERTLCCHILRWCITQSSRISSAELLSLHRRQSLIGSVPIITKVSGGRVSRIG